MTLIYSTSRMGRTKALLKKDIFKTNLARTIEAKTLTAPAGDCLIVCNIYFSLCLKIKVNK